MTSSLLRTRVPNSSAVLVGTARPVPAGSRAVLQRGGAGGWRDVSSQWLGAGGGFRFTLAPVGAAVVQQRVVARGGAGRDLAAGPVSSWGATRPVPVSAAIANYLRTRRGSVSVALYDARTGRTATYADGTLHYSASIAKVSIMDAVLRRAAVQGRGLTAWERSQLVPMITRSDNAAATRLWNDVGGAPAITAVQRAVGAPTTVQSSLPGRWGLARTSATDEVAIVQATVWPNRLLRAGDQVYARGLMSGVIASQRWGVGAGAPAGSRVELKNGWLPYAGSYRVNSIGHVYGAGRDYVLAVLTDTPGTGYGSFTYGIATVEGVARLVNGQFGPVAPTRAPSVAPDASDAGQ